MAVNHCSLPQIVILVVTAGLLAGCPGPYQWRHEHPLQKQAVAVIAIAGRTVTLADGRTFELAGISMDGLNAEQVSEFDAALLRLVAAPPGQPFAHRPRENEPDTPPTLPTKARVVVFRTSDGRAIARIITDLYPRDVMPRRGIVLGFPFTPLVEHEYPISFDLGERLLREGRAYAASEELPPNVTMVDQLPASDPVPGAGAYPRPARLADGYTATADDAKARNLGVHYSRERALKLAAIADDRDEVARFLQQGVPVDAVSDGETALIAVTSRSPHRPKMAEWLVEHGADPDFVAEGKSAMSAAIREGHAWNIEPLLRLGTDPSAVVDGRSLLMFAGSPAVVELLLDHGAKPKDASEAAALMARLASFGWPRGIEMLLDQGFEANVPTTSGVLPLHAAVRSGKIEVVTLLLKRGADPNLVEPAGRQTATGILRGRKDSPENQAMLRLLTGSR